MEKQVNNRMNKDIVTELVNYLQNIRIRTKGRDYIDYVIQLCMSKCSWLQAVRINFSLQNDNSLNTKLYKNY